jgi:hypothetical protein
MQIVTKTTSRNIICIAILVIFMIGNDDEGCAGILVVFFFEFDDVFCYTNVGLRFIALMTSEEKNGVFLCLFLSLVWKQSSMTYVCAHKLYAWYSILMTLMRCVKSGINDANEMR